MTTSSTLADDLKPFPRACPDWCTDRVSDDLYINEKNGAYRVLCSHTRPTFGPFTGGAETDANSGRGTLASVAVDRS